MGDKGGARGSLVPVSSGIVDYCQGGFKPSTTTTTTTTTNTSPPAPTTTTTTTTTTPTPTTSTTSTEGILTVGGMGPSGRIGTAEIFNPISGRSCQIVDIPKATDGLTLCGNIACGGWQADKSCSLFDGEGTFTALSVTLTEQRLHHLCWQLRSGEVLLLGGWYSGSITSTERISADGTSS